MRERGAAILPVGVIGFALIMILGLAGSGTINIMAPIVERLVPNLIMNDVVSSVKGILDEMLGDIFPSVVVKMDKSYLNTTHLKLVMRNIASEDRILAGGGDKSFQFPDQSGCSDAKRCRVKTEYQRALDYKIWVTIIDETTGTPILYRATTSSTSYYKGTERVFYFNNFENPVIKGRTYRIFVESQYYGVTTLNVPDIQVNVWGIFTAHVYVRFALPHNRRMLTTFIRRVES